MRPVLLYTTAAFFLPLISSAMTGTVLDAHKYAWSNNSGYINFANLIVDDAELSGYAWSANHGWIKFNPAQGGVVNDGSGNLSGYAWGEQLGWINFNGVEIDDSGRFSGIASGDLIGTLTFDCTHCDVETDWRPSSSDSSRGTSFRNTDSGELISKIPGTTPEEVGIPRIIVTETSVGPVSLSVPAAPSLADILFTIIELPLAPSAEYVFLHTVELVHDTVFEVTATDQLGNRVTSFSYPITITLPVPRHLLNTTELGVYWLNETNNQWVLIPDAVFSETKVSFDVLHLTKFAIFATVRKSAPKPALPVLTEGGMTPTPQSTPFPWFAPALISLLSVCLIYFQRWRHLR